MAEFTFTAATTDLDTMQVLTTSDLHFRNEGAPNGDQSLGPQIAICDCDVNTTGGSLVFDFVLCNDALDTVYARLRATAAYPGTAKRTNNAGTGGNYIVDLTFDESGDNKLDLNRGVPSGQKAHWRIGPSTFSTISTAKLRVALVRAV